MDASRRTSRAPRREPRLPPARGRCPNGLDEEHVQCMLRIPPAYRDRIRELAERNDTSAGGAVMLLLDALRDNPSGTSLR